MNSELKTRQICLFFIAFLPVTKLFTLPSIMATKAEEDMWIATIINALLDIGTLVALIFTCKKTNTTFFGMIERVFGKVGAKIIVAFYFIYFMLKGILPINEQKDYVEFTLYTLLPTTFYFLPFFIVSLYFCAKRLRVIGRVSDILWIVTLIGFFLLFVLSISNVDFTAILPIGANGAGRIFRASYCSLPWFGDSMYLMFFAGEFAYKKKDGIKIVLSYIASIIMVLFFMFIFYCIFTSIAHRQRFALTEISKYTTVINNIGRFDYIGILMILLSNFFAISLPLFFATKTLNYICEFKKQWIAPIIVICAQLLFSILCYEYFATVEKLIVNYGGMYFLLLGNILPVLTVFLVRKEKKYAYQKS